MTICIKIIKATTIISFLVFLTIAFIVAYSPFTDIHDIIKITNCYEEYASMCEKPPIIIMLYYMKTPFLYFILPQLIIWLGVSFVYKRKTRSNR